MFFMENILTGSMALVFGMIVENIIYIFIHALVMYIFGSLNQLSFTFSIETIGLTLLYFVCIYLFTPFRNKKQIAKIKIYDLLYFDKKMKRK